MKAIRYAVSVGLCAAALAACDSPTNEPIPDTTTSPPETSASTPLTGVEGYVPPPAPIPRLTSDQIRASLRDVFGDDVTVGAIIEPDPVDSGFEAVGAGVATVSPRGVESFESLAYDLAAQVVAPERRDRLVTCTPAATRDDVCAGETLAALGQRLWRRPVTDAQLERLVTLAGESATTLDDFYAGLEFAVAAMVQSPHFLFRKEVGEPDPDRPGERVLTSWELASRLSYLLWGTTPDDALLAAAESGELETAEGLLVHAERMLDDERARDGVLNFFVELYRLAELDDLSKDPTLFTAMSPELGPAAREETLRLVEHMVFEADADFREILTTRLTFIDRRLAALYGVIAPSRDGFAPARLPAAVGRRGLLGHASFLALNSHPVSTSATLRGMFVRETLLCTVVPPPPADVDTSIPEPSGTTRTLRERVAEHLLDESCASCHNLTDPIGLAFENYDGVGAWRDEDNGARIDPSGDLDGREFTDASDLAELVASHPNFGSCLAQNFYRYATAAQPAGMSERAMIAALAERFEASGFRVRELVLETVASDAFRRVGGPADPIAEEGTP